MLASLSTFKHYHQQQHISFHFCLQLDVNGLFTVFHFIFLPIDLCASLSAYLFSILTLYQSVFFIFLLSFNPLISFSTSTYLLFCSSYLSFGRIFLFLLLVIYYSVLPICHSVVLFLKFTNLYSASIYLTIHTSGTLFISFPLSFVMTAVTILNEGCAIMLFCFELFNYLFPLYL